MTGLSTVVPSTIPVLKDASGAVLGIPVLDVSKRGQLDDPSGSGLTGVQVALGEYVQVPFRPGHVVTTGVGFGFNRQDNPDNELGRASALQLAPPAAPAGYATANGVQYTVSFAGSLFGVASIMDRSAGLKDFTVMVDGVAVRVTALDPYYTAYSGGIVAVAPIMTHRGLDPMKVHHAVIAMPAEPPGGATKTVYLTAMLLDKRFYTAQRELGYVQDFGAVPTVQTALSLAGNGVWIRTVRYNNPTAGAVTLQVWLRSSLDTTVSMAAGASFVVDLGRDTAIGTTLASGYSHMGSGAGLTFRAIGGSN